MVVFRVAGSNFRTFGVKGNSNGAAGFGSGRSAGIVNDRLMIVIGTVREVHADNVETSISKIADCFDAVGLWANGANDGRATIVALGFVGSVERGKPSDPASDLKVVLGSGGHDTPRAGAALGWQLRHSRKPGQSVASISDLYVNELIDKFGS